MDIPFAIQAYQHTSRPLSAQRVINMYAEAQPRGAKKPIAVLGPPGIVTELSLGVGPVRGFTVMDGVLYAVSGTKLIQINSDNTSTELGGDISGNDVVSIANNGTQIVVTNGVSGYIWSSIAGFRLISDTDFGAANTVTFMDSFFLFDRAGTGQAFRSDQLDGTTYDGTAFATAESQPDDLRAVYNLKQILYLLGETSIELWGNAGAANFPFQRIPGATLTRGLAGSFALTDEDEALFLLADDRIAYRLSGRSLQRISTHALEQAWQRYSAVTDTICFAYTWNGHKFIHFTFPKISATLVYDIATGLWHERMSHDRLGNPLGRWRVNCVAEAYDKIWAGDAFTGRVGTFSDTTYTEFGDNTRAELVSPPLHGDGKRMFMPWFELDIETGVGLASGQGEDPQVMLSISDDGGRSFAPPEAWVSAGKTGEYDGTAYQLRWDRLGSFFTRNLKVTMSDPVRRAIYSARAPEMSIGL